MRIVLSYQIRGRKGLQAEVCGIENARKVVVDVGITAAHENAAIREHMATGMVEPWRGRGGEHLKPKWIRIRWIIKKRIKNGSRAIPQPAEPLEAPLMMSTSPVGRRSMSPITLGMGMLSISQFGSSGLRES
jgi:hypothetical protein